MRGAKPTMKKWRRGKGIRFTASLRRSEFSCPGKRRQHVTPLIVVEIKWFRSPTAMPPTKTHTYVTPCMSYLTINAYFFCTCVGLSEVQ